MNDYDIYACDFDGTIVENAYPEIGSPKQKIIDFCIRKKTEGHKLILWTCRTGEELTAAVNWCAEHGLTFDAVNENLPDEIVKFNNDPRKIGYDFLIDDRNITLDDIERGII